MPDDGDGQTSGCLEKKRVTSVLRFLLSLQFFASLVLAILGLILAADSYVIDGLGKMPSTTGGFVVFVSLGQMVSCTCGRFGTRTHNKFCLLIYMIAQLTGTIFIAILVSATINWATDDYDSSLQVACAKQGINSTCSEFLNDDKRMRMRKLWRDLFAETELQLENSRSAKSVLQSIQTDGRCCGFDPPYACQYGSATQKFVDADYLQGSSVVPDRCGMQSQWYFPTEECSVEGTMTNGTSYQAGCPYFLPGGSCMYYDFTNGCVYQMRIYLLERCLPILDGIDVLASFSIVTSVFTFILFMKRKDNDVVPTAYVVAHRPSKFTTGKAQKVQPK